MSNTTVTPPAATPVALVPISGYKSYIAGAAGLISLVVLPYLHTLWPQVPALSVDATTGMVGAILSLGIIFHRMGLTAAANYVLKNIVPVVLPPLESMVKAAVKQELVALQPQATAAGIDLTPFENLFTSLGVTPSLALNAANQPGNVTINGKVYDVSKATAAVAKLAAPKV